MARRVRTLVTAGLLAMALIAAGCGGDDDGGSATTAAPGTTSGGTGTTTATSAGPATTAAPDDVDPNGTATTYMDLIANGGPDMDPSKVRVSPPTFVQGLVYGNLFRANLDGTFDPELAESAEIVDPSNIKIELREGVTFSDGTPYDAAALKAGIERNRDAKNSTLSAELQEIDAITVDDPLTITIHLKTPIAGALYDRLPYGDFMVPSPAVVTAGGDLSAKPVGAGPFLLDSVEPQRAMHYVKNPAYWDAANIRIAKVDVIHVDTASIVTAIQSGSVNVANNLSYEQSKALTTTGWEITTEATDNIILWGQACKNRPPFDNLDVRLALNYAVDRDAINAAVFDGKGEPQWGFFASDSPLHDDSLDGFFDQDQDRAKQLLAGAGASDLTFDTFFTPGVSQRAVEIIQSQLAEIGVTMNLKPLTSAAEFFPDAKGAPINIFPLERSGIQKVARNLVPPSVGNICGWSDPVLNDLVAKIKAVAPEDPEAVTLWADLQRHTMETAANFFGLFGVRAYGFDPDRIGDGGYLQNFQGRPEFNYYRAYVKQ